MQSDQQHLVEPLLDSEAVGAILGRHPRTVLNLAAAGEIASVRLGHRGVRFRAADVQSYIESHLVAHGGDAG